MNPDEEAALDDRSRASLAIGRVLQKRDPDSTANRSHRSSKESRMRRWLAPELAEEANEDGYEEESTPAQHAQQPVGGKVGKQSSWLAFGLELANAGLSADEEKQLGQRSRASLAAGRVMRARQANAAKKEEPKASSWLDFGMGTRCVGVPTLPQLDYTDESPTGRMLAPRCAQSWRTRGSTPTRRPHSTSRRRRRSGRGGCYESAARLQLSETRSPRGGSTLASVPVTPYSNPQPQFLAASCAIVSLDRTTHPL